MKITERFQRLGRPTKALLLVLMLLFGLAITGACYIGAKLDRVGFAGGNPFDSDFGTGLSRIDELDLLLLGTDERTVGGGLGDFDASLQSSARADACMLLHLDFEKHAAQLVSLERSIGVAVPQVPGGKDWLTHAFAYGGADAMLEAVRSLTGREVQRYVRVNVGSAADLIDAIGGVDIVLTEIEAAALNGEINTNSVTRHRVEPGLNHLDGFDALAYARQRFIDSDFERVQRQRNVLQAAIDQTKTLSLKQLDRLLNTALPLVETNITKNEMMALLYRVPGFLGVQLDQLTLPIDGMYGVAPTGDGRNMLMPDHEETVRILTALFEGTFDLETYVASDEVQSRVWQAQKQAYASVPAPPPAPEPAPSVDSGAPTLDSGAEAPPPA